VRQVAFLHLAEKRPGEAKEHARNLRRKWIVNGMAEAVAAASAEDVRRNGRVRPKLQGPRSNESDRKRLRALPVIGAAAGGITNPEQIVVEGRKAPARERDRTLEPKRRKSEE
jgi:hypothetical protein